MVLTTEAPAGTASAASQGKRQTAADKPGQLTMRIHGKWYDVTEFSHPGGPVSIGLGHGRDATALFEAHHPFVDREKLHALLQKYEVPEECSRDFKCYDQREELMMVDGNYHEPFTWAPEFDDVGSAFWKDLREQVRTYFQNEATRRGVSFRDAYKATPWRWAEMLVLLGTLFALLPFYFQGYWFTLPIVPLLWWVMAVNVMHDAAHFSVSSRWWVNATLSHATPSVSPLMWYHQHVIGHHAYPNVGFRDPDLAHAPLVMRTHESVRWRRMHRFQLVTLFLIWTLGSSLYMSIVPIKMVMFGHLNRVVRLNNISTFRKVRHYLGRFLALCAFFVWPWLMFPWWQATVWATLPLFVFSVCFMLNTQVNHFTPDTAAASDRDFWRHQAATAHSFAQRSYWSYLFSGGLNFQIEHHLFPTVNHVHMKYLSPMVKATCIRHGVPYSESSGYFSAMEKYVSHIMNMSSKPTHGAQEKIKR